MAQPDAAPTSPRIHAKRRRRRAQILHAALRAFREKGYHQTTLEDIAGRLGVGKTALYHYFWDKEAILYACHRESLAELGRLVRAARASGAPAPEQLARLVRDHVRVMTDTLEGSPLAFEVTALSPARQRKVVAARDRYEGELRGLIAAGIAAGAFRPVDPKLATFAILGAINWIARWYRPEGDVHAAELGAQFADLLIGGLTCR